MNNDFEVWWLKNKPNGLREEQLNLVKPLCNLAFVSGVAQEQKKQIDCQYKIIDKLKQIEIIVNKGENHV